MPNITLTKRIEDLEEVSSYTSDEIKTLKIEITVLTQVIEELGKEVHEVIDVDSIVTNVLKRLTSVPKRFKNAFSAFKSKL